MFILILALPLASALILIFWGSYIGTYGSLVFSCANLLLAFIFSIGLFLNITHDFTVFINL
jgi:hypothetical protein